MPDELIAQAEGTGTPPTVPSTETQSQITTAPEVDTAQETAAPQRPPETEREKGLKHELFKLRARERERKIEFDSLRQEVENLKVAGRGAIGQQTQTAETGNVNLLDNPELFQANLEKRLSTSLETRLAGIIERREQEVNLAAQGRAAESWLLAQKEIIEDPAAVEEITEILSDPELARVAQVSPSIAAKQALAVWKEQKGLAGNRNDAARAAATRTHSAPPSAGGSGNPNKKTWTAAEAKSYLATLDHRAADFNEKYAVIEKAMKEGRIK